MILHWIDQHREDLLQFASDLIATPSQNLPGDERAVVKIILAQMQQLGLCGVEIAAKEPHRPNVVYRLKGQEPGPILMLCGHSDTKPIGNQADWHTDPLKPTIRDGKMYGLGSTDMKGAVAAMVFAVAALKDCQADQAGDLLLVINADEERSMTFGSEYLATQYGIKADVGFVG